MTPQQHLDARLDVYARRAEATIAHRMADAAAHSKLGQAALADRRLTDLLDALATPDGRGIIGDVAAEAFRDAFRFTPFNADVHAPHWQHPTAEGIRVARMAAADARPEAESLVDRARQVLPLIAGDRDAIDAWHDEHRAALTRWAKAAISDTQVGVFHATNHARHKPELRGDHEGPRGV